MKKKLSSDAGLTLVEILIAVVISVLMMAAMFTSYSIVNSTYRQVTDRAKISQAGRDLVGQILREVRMAGYKYINDDIPAYRDQKVIIDENEYPLAGAIAQLSIKKLDKNFNLKNAAPIYIRNNVAKTISERKIDLKAKERKI